MESARTTSIGSAEPSELCLEGHPFPVDRKCSRRQPNPVHSITAAESLSRATSDQSINSAPSTIAAFLLFARRTSAVIVAGSSADGLPLPIRNALGSQRTNRPQLIARIGPAHVRGVPSRAGLLPIRKAVGSIG